MIRRTTWVLISLCALTVCIDVEAAPEDRDPASIVRARSATPATGPLPPPARAQPGLSPQERLARMRASATEARKPKKPAPDVTAWQAAVQRLFEGLGQPADYVDAGARDVDVAGMAGRLLDAGTAKGEGRVRFVRLEGGNDDAARAFFDRRFELFEHSGSYVRKADGPGDRAVVTNLIDPPKKTVVWQVGRVVAELTTPNDAAIEVIHDAAREAGLYAATLEVEPATPDKDNGEDEFEFDDDLGLEDESLPDAPFNGYDIPSLKAYVKGVRFFEGGSEMTPPDRRGYTQRLASEATRFIYWELALEHVAPGRRLPFRIDARWRRQDGSVLVEQQYDSFVAPEWTSSTHSTGHGQAILATWASGRYRVDLSVGGKVVASGTFEVTATARIHIEQLQHNQVDEHGQNGVLIRFRMETWGRLNQDTLAVGYFEFANGTPLKDFDGHYADSTGHVATHVTVRPLYEHSVWNETRLFVPYTQLHLSKGKHDLRVYFILYDAETSAPLARSGSAAMTITMD